MVVEAICTYWEEGSVNLLGKLTEEVRKKAQENDDEEDKGRNSVTVKAGNFLESSVSKYPCILAYLQKYQILFY